jgi:hypothetical protein
MDIISCPNLLNLSPIDWHPCPNYELSSLFMTNQNVVYSAPQVPNLQHQRHPEPQSYRSVNQGNCQTHGVWALTELGRVFNSVSTRLFA